MVKALVYHDLFRLVHGNPMAIRFMAACYSDKSSPKSLLELYERVNHEKSLKKMMEETKEARLSPKSKPKISKNNLSLNFSTEAIIQMLEEGHPACLQLFYFLGCLPGGLLIDQLHDIWEDCDEPIQALREFSFLEDDDKKIVLNSHLLRYFDLSFDPKCKNSYIN